MMKFNIKTMSKLGNHEWCGLLPKRPIGRGNPCQHTQCLQVSKKGRANRREPSASFDLAITDRHQGKTREKGQPSKASTKPA